MTNDQIKHMVNRFLGWRLPDNFNPDGGISFRRTFNEHTDHPMKSEPVGTNLFDATQAEEMVRYMVEQIPPNVDDNYVAWLRFTGDEAHRRLVVCDSDAPGAFKVWRRPDEARPTPAPACPFRVGGKVPLNVYEGDRPVFQAHTPEEAARLVALLNAGLEHQAPAERVVR